MIERFVNGRVRSNAYLVVPGGAAASPPERDAVVVDAGSRAAARIVRRADELGVTPRALLLTHGHPDHTSTARALAHRYGIPAYLHAADWRWLGPRWRRPSTLQALPDTLEVAGVTIEVLHTPGHTAGSSCFLVDRACFTGDTLFAGGVGTTVYPGGNRDALRRSVRALLELDDSLELYPGHGRAAPLRDVAHLVHHLAAPL